MSQKIVINTCFGGFGMSDAAYRRYAEIKGVTLYPELDRYGRTTYWLVPPEQRIELAKGQWEKMSLPERQEWNRSYTSKRLYDGDIARDDPTLVQVVEELGTEKASGQYGALEVVEIPDGVEWEIDEYDGTETIHEKHRSWS